MHEYYRSFVLRKSIGVTAPALFPVSVERGHHLKLAGKIPEWVARLGGTAIYTGKQLEGATPLSALQTFTAALTASVPLQRLESVLSLLAREVSWINDEIRALRATSASANYCVDYDVLFPVASAQQHPNEEETADAYWSSLALLPHSVPVILLPGTLFEILSFAEERLEFAKGISRTALADAFISSMSTPDVAKVSDLQQKVLLAFQRASYSESEMYLYSIVKRAQGIAAPFPAIDKQLFYQCIVQLSQGKRLTKTTNNRVDGFNYTFLSALNNQRRQDRFFLISNSSYMRQLDNHNWHRNELIGEGRARSSNALMLWRLQNRRFVLTPRRASIFRLITSAGDGVGSKSAKLALELQAALHDARQQVAEKIVASGEPPVRGPELEVRSDNVFLQIISSFFGLQNKIVEATNERRETIEINRKQYDFRNSVAFFEDLYESVSQKLRDFGYRETLKTELPEKPADLKLVERDHDTRFSHARHIDALGPAHDLVFSYFFYPESISGRGKSRHLFVSRGKLPIESFLSLYNVIVGEISAKISAGVYEGLEQDTSGATLIVGDGKKFVERPLGIFNGHLELDGLIGQFDEASAEVSFLRINLPWFELSYEGKAFAFASHQVMPDEIALFLQETAAIGNRTANFRQSVTQLLSPRGPR